MRLHYLQHVPFEDAANIAAWAADRGHPLSHTRLDLDEPLPAQEAFDWLVVMGGPMNADEHAAYPWLLREKAFLRSTIDRHGLVLGVCLGAQLLAEVLGGTVAANGRKEIGWYPITLTEAAARSAMFRGFARQLPAFHWHGDTFSIPPRAVRLAGSATCANQAFQAGDRLLGLQFHWDYSPASVQTMIRHCGGELVDAPGIQQPPQMLADPEPFRQVKELLYQLLDAMAAQGPG
ncbi:MAG: type 1 glutamine amidotransferase [Thermoguttaceae bacterium]|jgi:GMP synthase-like glutamine amidotransferase